MKEREGDRRLKILELPSWYIPDGGEFVWQQADALRRAGIDVAVAANTSLSWKKYRLKVPFFPHKIFSIYEKGVLTYRYYTRRLPKAENYNLKNWIEKTIRLCEEYIGEQGVPDLIHVHSAMWAGSVALALKSKYNIPYVITEHRGRFSECADEHCLSLKESDRSELQKIFSNASHIIPVSSLLIKKIQSYLTADVPISVISNVIDVNLFSYKEKHCHELFTFICVNHFEELKGYDVLLAAFDKVCDQNPKVRLQIVGGRFENAAFRQMWKQCRHRDKIKMMGAASSVQVADYLKEADAFVLPSRVESQSIAVLEAMATGLPVVGTAVVPPEMLSAAHGFRVPINDSDAFANAMLQMVLHYDEFEKSKIASDILELASISKVMDKLLTLYNTVVYE